MQALLYLALKYDNVHGFTCLLHKSLYMSQPYTLYMITDLVNPVTSFQHDRYSPESSRLQSLYNSLTDVCILSYPNASYKVETLTHYNG